MRWRSCEKLPVHRLDRAPGRRLNRGRPSEEEAPDAQRQQWRQVFEAGVASQTEPDVEEAVRVRREVVHGLCWIRAISVLQALLQDHDGGICKIGLARWPRWQLFGFRSDPEGTLSLRLDPGARPCRLLLSYECEAHGSIRVSLPEVSRRELGEAVPLTGSSTGKVAAWEQGEVLLPDACDQPVTAKLHLVPESGRLGHIRAYLDQTAVTEGIKFLDEHLAASRPD